MSHLPSIYRRRLQRLTERLEEDFSTLNEGDPSEDELIRINDTLTAADEELSNQELYHDAGISPEEMRGVAESYLLAKKAYSQKVQGWQQEYVSSVEQSLTDLGSVLGETAVSFGEVMEQHNEIGKMIREGKRTFPEFPSERLYDERNELATVIMDLAETTGDTVWHTQITAENPRFIDPQDAWHDYHGMLEGGFGFSPVIALCMKYNGPHIE